MRILIFELNKGHIQLPNEQKAVLLAKGNNVTGDGERAH